jgi:hypothetical protein
VKSIGSDSLSNVIERTKIDLNLTYVLLHVTAELASVTVEVYIQ